MSGGEEEEVARHGGCLIFLEEVALTKVMVTHASREREREREETSTTRQSQRTLQGEKTTNPDDLNTRIIQVKSQPSFIDNTALL